MIRCPHCGAAHCLSALRKLRLGPAGSAHCRVCGLRVGVDAGKAWLVMLPGLAAIMAMVMLAGFARFIAAATLWPLQGVLAAGVVALAVCYVYQVPLRVDEISNAELVRAGKQSVTSRHRPR